MRQWKIFQPTDAINFVNGIPGIHWAKTHESHNCSGVDKIQRKKRFIIRINLYWKIDIFKKARYSINPGALSLLHSHEHSRIERFAHFYK